jgi:hypothetical protein
MAISEARILELAAQLSASLDAAKERPQLRLVVPEHARPPGYLEDAKRDALLRRIRFLCSRFGLRWIIDQATDGAEPESLDDAALCALGRDCELALKCIQEGVSFLDVGLVRAYED